MDDPYSILEVGPEASADEIRANYRRLAMKWHPDRNAGSREAEERFKLISEAYSILSDPDQRQAYEERKSEQAEPNHGFQGFDGFAGFGAFAGFAAFTREKAASMFMEEMYVLATELTMQNVGWRDIAQELAKRGCPESTAAEIARAMEQRRKAMVRGNARPYFLRSAISGALGLALVSMSGFGLFGLFGIIGLFMFLSGTYNLVRAIYFMTTGNAPRSLV
jgi:curved DNA-binding protein CbpA